MKTIVAQNVNEALGLGIDFMRHENYEIESRVGTTLEARTPVATVYHHPWERVLISKPRDANPFFHLFEALWILAGRQDVKFLELFNSRMAEYSDDGKVFNAPYGYRLRKQVSGHIGDQLKDVIDILKKDPMSRQAVAQIWDPNDLRKQTLDKACNMQCVFRVRNDKLTLTVYNRSNDILWGTYGANAVQFSMILEYVAAHLGLEMGTYTQVSNSYHVYTTGPGGELWEKLKQEYNAYYNPYDLVEKMSLIVNEDSDEFDHDLNLLFGVYDYSFAEDKSGRSGLKAIVATKAWKTNYFRMLVVPMLQVFIKHKEQGAEAAIGYLGAVWADDWSTACRDWLTKRIKR